MEHPVPNFIFGKNIGRQWVAFSDKLHKELLRPRSYRQRIVAEYCYILSMTVKGRMISSRRQDMQSKFRENAFALAMLVFISLWVIMIA
jgi:hypothetical protein